MSRIPDPLPLDPTRPFILHPINTAFAASDSAHYHIVRIEWLIALAFALLVTVAVIAQRDSILSGLRLRATPIDLTGVVTARRDFTATRTDKLGNRYPVERVEIAFTYRVDDQDYQARIVRDRREVPVLLAIGDTIPIQIAQGDARAVQWAEPHSTLTIELLVALTILSLPYLVLFSFTRTNILLARRGRVLTATIREVRFHPEVRSTVLEYGTLHVEARFTSPTGRKKEVHSLRRLYPIARGIPQRGQLAKVIWYNDKLYRLL